MFAPLSSSLLQRGARLAQRFTASASPLSPHNARAITMLGYLPDFLGPGFEVQLPTFSDDLLDHVLTEEDIPETDFQDGAYTTYIHYSVATNKSRRQPIVVALNINQSLLKVVPRGGWHTDPQVGEYQLDNTYYKNNAYDRGHLARRSSAAWGETEEDAEEAGEATMFYSNAALQHAKFNQDEWVHLEDWVKGLELDSTDKISVFSGPIYTHRRGVASFIGSPPAEIPTAFFKVVCFVDKENEFSTRAFIVAQDKEAISDKNARTRSLDLGAYQVPIQVIEEETGLVFDDIIRSSDSLGTIENPNEPPIIPANEDNVMSDSNKKGGVGEFADVFILSAMVNPRGSDRENEWISIANFSEFDLDLTGWKLSDTKRKAVDISGIIIPGEARRIGNLAGMIMANTGGQIALLDPDNSIVDRVTYSNRSHNIKENVPIRFHVD